jgi:hypothetical protein
MLSREEVNINVIVFDPAQGLKPTIYRTQGEHANYYTINVVASI